MGKGSSGPNQTYSDVTQTTSNLPEYAEPYFRDLLNRTAFETAQPYQTYEGQRLAYFSPLEQEAMARYGELGMSGTPAELNFAGQVAAGIAGSPIEANVSGARSTYSPTGLTANHGLSTRQSGYNPTTRESTYVAGQMDPDSNYVAGQRQVGFTPGSLADPNVISQYMSPYFQEVLDVEKREAARQADIRRKELGLEAAGQGSLGGYREGIEQAETERNLMQNMADIQTKGTQSAFESALGSFEADRAARAKLEEFEQSQFGMNEQVRQRQAELMMQGFSFNEAARQAQEEFAMTQYGMNQQALQTGEQLRQSQHGMNVQDKQFQSQLNANMQIAADQARQRAAELNLSAAQITQAGQIAALQAKIAMEQNRLAGAGMLGDFSAQRQGMELERLQMMQQAGLAERNMAQAGLDMGYQDFLRQQAYPRENLALYSAMLQGTPVAPGTTTATFGDEPSGLQQALGSGISAAALMKMLGDGG